MQSTKGSAKSSGTSRKPTAPTIKATKAVAADKKATAQKMPVVKRAATAIAVRKTPAAKKPARKSRPVTFKIQSKPNSKVYLAGDFNEWNNLLHELTDYDSSGVYQIEIELEPGVYEYKFHINNAWFIDPENPNFRPNNFGTLNSVIIID
ncbi:MAG: glycogen-binding domain-containing protein [Victivallaceae bacterium]